jgi:methionyl-tRNA formyltransferase
MKALVMGYHTMGCLGFDALRRNGFEIPAVFTHHDDPSEEIWWDSLAERAQSAGVPVHYPESMKAPAMRDLVAFYEPDFIFSFYFRFMIPPEILSLARLGALNLHGSLLPKYRGRAPVNWVLVNGETETGVSLHYMVAKPDAGDLVDQEPVAIAFEETPLTLYRKLEEAAVKVLDRSLPLLMQGHAPSRPLDLTQGTYYGGRRPEDGLLNWQWPALKLFYLIRGVTHPYPGAFTYFRGRKLFVWWGRPEGNSAGSPAGTVMIATAEGLVVSTGEGALRITQCQFEGEPEYDGYTLSTLHGILPGARLGLESETP